MELLLNKGAKIHVKINCGRNLLELACACGHVSIVELLLSRGAMAYGKAGYAAIKATCKKEIKNENHLCIIKLLLLHGSSTFEGKFCLMSHQLMLDWPLNMLIYCCQVSRIDIPIDALIMLGKIC